MIPGEMRRVMAPAGSGSGERRVVGAEGDVGAYWGLWDKDAKPKFA